MNREAISTDLYREIRIPTSLVVKRDDIITAYIPDEYYMKNNILKKGVKIYEADDLSD